MSGISPTMKNTVEIVRYVEIANTSHTSGDLKFGQRSRWLLYGSRKYANHMRPAWMSGNRPADMSDGSQRGAVAMDGERLRGWLYPAPDTNWFTKLRLMAQYFLVTTFFHVFPLPRRSGFRRSFAYAGKCVDRGESVLVFPEGERAPRGQMQMSSFKPGIGLLVNELDVPVVPVNLRGLYELKKRKQYFASPGMVTVVFGEPVKFDSEMKPVAIAEELERRVAER